MFTLGLVENLLRRLAKSNESTCQIIDFLQQVCESIQANQVKINNKLC